MFTTTKRKTYEIKVMTAYHDYILKSLLSNKQLIVVNSCLAIYCKTYKQWLML